ncbi:hypothetical protein SAMN02910456_00093 [Ruminococcaceae bacterium YRB3002]|nr:hypothetical protein SAMN02910456_00093 [Ruminococcaceae bacterium YRB3002]
MYYNMSYFSYISKQIYYEETGEGSPLMGSLEDDMFPKRHCKVLFDEICAKTSLATAHIFEHGGHPAMLSNMDEFVELC